MRKTASLFILIMSALFFLFTGCSNDDTFTEKSYVSNDDTIETITVDVSDREIEVSVSEDDQIYIDYFDSEKEYLDITVENSELTVKLVYDKDWTDFIGVKPSAQYRKITMRIPDNKISVFSANTANEDIKINTLSFTENISLNANGGDIKVEKLNIGEAVSLTAKNGNIQGSIVGSWDDFSISCNIKKGECNLPALKEGGKKSLSADCNNGDINIEFVL